MAQFKRNIELIEKAKSIRNEENAEVIDSLIKEIERNTYKEYNDRYAFFADVVDGFTNDFSCDSTFKEINEKMVNNHPTLQQSYMKGVVGFIELMAKKTHTDGRNERAVNLAKKLNEVIEENGCYLPCI